MKNNKKFSLLTVLLAVLAACLLLVGGIGVTRAVLIESDTYSGTLETPDIAIQLNENGTAVSGEDALLQGLFKEGESFTIGKIYDEVLTVTNTGSADQFARVTLYKYWTDEEGKRVDLDPAISSWSWVKTGQSMKHPPHRRGPSCTIPRSLHRVRRAPRS